MRPTPSVPPSRPVIIAGGGVHYSRAEAELAAFAEEFGIPVVETVAGKSCLLADHPRYAGPVGVTGAGAANVVVTEADLVIAIGTRLEDFTTGSWTVFDPSAQLRRRQRRSLRRHQAPLDPGRRRRTRVAWPISPTRCAAGRRTTSGPSAAWRCASSCRRFVDGRTADDGVWPPSYAQLVGLVHESATEDDYVMTAAGGLPGELNINWMIKAIASFDCDYGFSCMGYEIAGAWGAAFGRPTGQVYSMVGDGSYLMMNSEIYASVLSGRKFILVVCDNEGYAVIERLQVGPGRRVVQQHAQGLRGHRSGRAGRLRRARAVDGCADARGRQPRGVRGGARRRPVPPIARPSS